MHLKLIFYFASFLKFLILKILTEKHGVPLSGIGYSLLECLPLAGCRENLTNCMCLVRVETAALKGLLKVFRDKYVGTV
jgi:hypothetical protein